MGTTRRHTVIAALLATVAWLIAAAWAQSASAATILIDFNDGAGTPGVGWNVFDAADSGSTLGLIADDGSSTGFDVSLPSFFDSPNPGWNPANARPSWAPASATDDYSYFGGGGTIVTFSFLNLDPTLQYQIDLIVSRDLNRSQDHRLTNGGGFLFEMDWNSQTDGWQNGQVIRFAPVTPNASDQINLDIRRDSISGAFNAMRIVTIPESTTLALGALTLAALSLRQGAQRRGAARRRARSIR